MSTPLAAAQAARQRNLLFFREPRRWMVWPFLPVMRRRPGCEEELGLLFDAVGTHGLYGLSATVYFCNLFMLPGTLHEFLSLPRETYDTADEVADAGWEHRLPNPGAMRRSSTHRSAHDRDRNSPAESSASAVVASRTPS